MIAGIVVCDEDGELKPHKGVKVTIKTIYDSAGGDSYDLPKPETATTDASGIWVMSFGVPYSSTLTYPGGFKGELTGSCCKPFTIRLVEHLEPYPNLTEGLGGISGNASSAAALVKSALSKLSNIKGLLGPSTHQHMAYGGYVYTEGNCSKKPPVVDK